ncbi:hypothetical protein OUZ56_007461 [Daphnia magna]|uniref:Uncharacterized protein n=1 Tax=Daphnia magna TaxID=35525 RepID=A0ABR0AA77_9CRUS|nr:hypothetical protein OUZ56_007461 [Daphnia magna]
MMEQSSVEPSYNQLRIHLLMMGSTPWQRFRIRATDTRETNWKWEHVVTTATPPHALDALYELPLSAL